MIKKVCSLLLAATMLTGAGSSLTVAAAEKEDSKHTPNVSVLTLKSEKNVSKFVNAEGEEVDLSDLNTSAFSRRRVALPSKYDLRDEGRSTSVKNQETDGFCWSFASVASMESNIITNKIGNATSENIDLSETGGAWFSCNGVADESDSTYGDHRDDPSNGADGGNAEEAAESLSSGYGTYPEELASYEKRTQGYEEDLRYYSDYKLKDYTKIPEDINLIKQRLMEKGAIFYAYKCFEDNYYETEDGKWTYVDNGKSIYGDDRDGGHAVTLIGWDDNFSKDNFHPEVGVENDGAWLCKNSWGDSWGEDGYFWISYESYLYYLGQFEMQDKDSFDTIHQHQTTSEQYMTSGDDEENPQYFTCANVFTAKTTEELEQICYSNGVNSYVNAKIYKLNKDYTSPVDGELLAEFDSDTVYAGTHCLEVPGNIIFNEGDVFSVVIEGDTLLANFRYEDAEHLTNDIAGKSYFSDNGTDWTDVADFSDASYAAIKAYTTTKTPVDKTELKSIVESVKGFKPTNEAEQELFEKNSSKLNQLLEQAEDILVDDDITKTDFKNFCCVLKAELEALKIEKFSVNNLDDFKTLYYGVRNGEFNNRYVELNTDLDLSGFDIDENDIYSGNIFNTSKPALYLNGKGHTIKNFDEKSSLFGELSKSTIKNLNIENCNASGSQYIALLADTAENSEFTSINVKNSTVIELNSDYSALLVGRAADCTFVDCCAEKCRISGYSVGLFFSQTAESESTVINCNAKDYNMYAYVRVDDNMGFNCSYQVETGLGEASIEVTDDSCTLRRLIGEIEFVKLNDIEIAPVGTEYHIDKSNGSVVLSIGFKQEDIPEFDYSLDLENQTAYVSGYYGSEKDIVIPEKILGFDVVGLSEKFDVYGIDVADVNSITVPGGIKQIPSMYFIRITGLKKIIINDGVEEIGDHALGYVETETGFEPIDGFTIYGYAGTVAETYANENGFDFVDLGA